MDTLASAHPLPPLPLSPEDRHGYDDEHPKVWEEEEEENDSHTGEECEDWEAPVKDDFDNESDVLSRPSQPHPDPRHLTPTPLSPHVRFASPLLQHEAHPLPRIPSPSPPPSPIFSPTPSPSNPLSSPHLLPPLPPIPLSLRDSLPAFPALHGTRPAPWGTTADLASHRAQRTRSRLSADSLSARFQRDRRRLVEERMRVAVEGKRWTEGDELRALVRGVYPEMRVGGGDEGRWQGRSGEMWMGACCGVM